MSEETLAAARAWVAAGFSVIPLKPRSKRPAISKWEPYQARRPTDKELVDWFTDTDNNLGLVMGAISGNAFAADYDDRDLAAYVLGDVSKLAQETFVQETAKGFHVVLRTEGEPVKSHNFRDRGLEMDIKGEGGYIVADPSIHPSGVPYRALSPGIVVKVMARANLDAFLARLEAIREEWPIVKPVLGDYTAGRRHDIALGLPAKLRDFGFSEDRALGIMQRICEVAGDEEIEDRLRAVKDTYAKPREKVSSSRLGPRIFEKLTGRRGTEGKTKDGEKDEKRREYVASYWVPGELIADEVLRDGRPLFCVRNVRTGTTEYRTGLEAAIAGEDVLLLPVQDDLLKKGAVVLPEEPQEYGDADKLFEEIVAFALRYASAPEQKVRIAVLSVMTSWVGEKVPVVPILNPRGGSETGKTRLGTLLWLVTPRGLRADGALSLSSLFRNVERWKGAVFLSEGDISAGRRGDESEARQLIKAFNAGYERPGTVWRTNRMTMRSEVFTVFGLKIICTRQGFPDDAMESRTFIIPMTTSRDKKKNLPPEAFDEARVLRNKLLAFRLDNLESFDNDYDLEFPEVTPRLNQILQPMASLARSRIPSFFEKIEAIARDIAESIVEERARSTDGLIVRAYLALYPEGGGATAKEIVDFIKENYSDELKPETVGRRIGPLGFVRSRASASSRARLFELPSELREEIARKYLPQDECIELLHPSEPRPSEPLSSFESPVPGEASLKPSEILPRENKILAPLEGVHPCDSCGSKASWKVAAGAWLKASCEGCLPKYGLEAAGPGGTA